HRSFRELLHDLAGDDSELALPESDELPSHEFATHGGNCQRSGRWHRRRRPRRRPLGTRRATVDDQRRLDLADLAAFELATALHLLVPEPPYPWPHRPAAPRLKHPQLQPSERGQHPGRALSRLGAP